MEREGWWGVSLFTGSLAGGLGIAGAAPVSVLGIATIALAGTCLVAIAMALMRQQ